MLYWDGDGFYLLYKRIEYGKFHFPKKITEDKYTVTNEELNWLLHGLQIENIRKYEKLKKERISTEKGTVIYNKYFKNFYFPISAVLMSILTGILTSIVCGDGILAHPNLFSVLTIMIILCLISV